MTFSALCRKKGLPTNMTHDKSTGLGSRFACHAKSCVAAICLLSLQRALDANDLFAAERLSETGLKDFSGARAGEWREVGGVQVCWCPPGRFKMGSPIAEPGRRPDEDQVEVNLTKGFWMGKYEVTQGQWKRVIGKLPGERSAIAGDGDDFPVYWVSFDAVETFCKKLTELAHRSRALPASWEFRIPTEAQWEYACRAGTTTATVFGDQMNHRQANFGGKLYDMAEGRDAGPAFRRATKVGSYPANAWGFHDMHGNEFEWCRDWYHSKLPGGVDPDLSTVKGTQNRDGTYSRVRRGGAWNDDGEFCRSAFRLRYEPHRNSDHIGFRVVLVETGRAGNQ
jgi:formylglycine-generating enzyme